MYNEDMNELYTVAWRPQSTDKHPLEDAINPASTPHSSALAYLGTVKTPSKPVGAYRPPGARGTLTPLAFKREDEGGAAYVNNGISSTAGGSGVNGFGRPKSRYVPGAEAAEPALPPGAAPEGGVRLPAEIPGDENLSKAALKNKKKREAKKERAAADKSGEAGDANGHEPAANGQQTNGKLAVPHDNRSQQQRREPSRSRKPKDVQPPPGLGNKPMSTPQPVAPATPPAPSEIDLASPNGGGSPHDKKVRGLMKKIRAIEELKMRQAGGEKLELSQLSKIKTEDQVRKELDALEI